MKFKLSIVPENEKTAVKSQKQLKEEVKKAADLWIAGKKEEAAAIFIDCFQNGGLPLMNLADIFAPYVRKLGKEYCCLIEKLYLVRLESESEDDDCLWSFLDFLEACPNDSIVHTLASKIVGGKWDEIQEKFYDKCPECMFMGYAAKPCSLKLRSQNVVECIPEGIGVHELSGMEYMDGYNQYEGFALVKEDPEAKVKYPAEIQAILKKVKARGKKHFPNLIFPLTEGENILETCDQMLELLQLLDYGYYFENISNYISQYPELFPEERKERKKVLKALAAELNENVGEDDDEDLNDDELTKLLSHIKLPGEDEEEKPKKKAPAKKRNN